MYRLGLSSEGAFEATGVKARIRIANLELTVKLGLPLQKLYEQAAHHLRLLLLHPVASAV